MIKILHIVGLAHGGAGQHVLSLASGCDPRRFESTVAMADSSPMRADFERAGVRVVPLSMEHYGGLRKNSTAFRQLAGILRRESFDVIETHTSVAGALGRVAARMFTRTPTVHMLHTFAGHPYRSKLSQVAARVIERRLDRFTDWYIAGSRAMVARGVSDGIFTNEKVVLISNGIDLTPFRRALENSPADAQATSNDGGQITVGFLGRLEKQKGVPYLIRAAAIVRQQNPRVRFVIAGDGTMRRSLERLVSELQLGDAVEFVGWKQDVAAFLKTIDIMAMPSLWEAFGLSAAEAMAMEKPVVASRTEGLPEVVEDGRTGLLVPPEDHASLARAILELAADPVARKTMGRRGRARAEAFFSLDRMISLHEDFYERIAARPSQPQVAAGKPLAQQRDTALSVAD